MEHRTVVPEHPGVAFHAGNPPAAFRTQRELSEKSGVNLRTIQQYERRSRDINKAAGATLRALSIALSCRIEDLLEYHDTPADLRRGD